MLGALLGSAQALAPALASAQWQPTEEVRNYAISGVTGAELYRSIGEKGPQVGGQSRVIAHTTFKLTWTRKYERQGNACVLTTAKPKLTIIYTLPKPSAKLSPSVKASWDIFIDAIRTHERVHGETIIDMVHEIETLSSGFSAEDDPECRKIRANLTERLGEISGRQRQRGRDFDQVEMSDGGNVQALILRLVNGP
jgi:predicted secreted Zn-dependent protease